MYEYEHSPLARILELGKLADFDKVTSNCSYFMLFKNNPLPKVPQSTITLIQEVHQSREKMSEILYNISFPFPVITQSIPDISRDLDKMSENNKIYSSIFLFYSFFAWFINFTKTGLVYPGDIVLSSLLNIKVEGSSNYEILAKSAFYFGYKTLVESKTTPLFDKYISTLKLYFIHHTEDETKTYPSLVPIVSGNLFIYILSHFEYPDQTTNDPVTLSKDLYEIVEIINESSILHPYVFNEEITFSILDFLKSYMCSNSEINSSKIIIKCFSNLLKLTNTDYSFVITSHLIPAIFNIINQDLKDLSVKNISEYENSDNNFNFSNQLITLPSNLEIIQDFKYPENQTFSKGFDRKPLKNIKIEDSQNLFKSLSDSFENFIHSLFFNENNIKSFISAVLLNFEKCDDQTEINHISFFLLFVLSIINQRKSDNIKCSIKYIDLIRPIMNSFDDKIDVIFNSNVTIFSENKSEPFSEELNTIRNEFLKNVIQRKKQLHKFLTNRRLFPVLFTEIVYRLTGLMVQIPLEFLNEIMFFFRFMNIMNIESTIVEIVRESLFNYISEVYSDSLFDGVSIQTSYFLCLMEDNLVDEIINIFKDYFEHATTVVDTKSFALFLKLFHINSISDQPNVIKVMIRFVKLLLSIFQTKVSFSRSFKSSYLELFNILSNIKMNEELLRLVLSLFILISQEYELSEIEAFHLKKSILTMNQSSGEINNYESFYPDILKLISIDNLHIYNPRVLQIAYILFSSIKFDEFIENFLYTNLLKNSPHAIENCQKCHTAEFDCFLLDELFEMKKKDYSTEREEQIKKILSVFETISKYFSSPTAVLKFTSLLRPKKEKVLSRYMPLFMNTLSKLVEVDYWKKTKHMKLDETDEYSGDFIVPKLFSICFWISCRSFDSEGNLNIFSANSVDNEIKDQIKIYIYNNDLKIEINEINCTCPIKKDEWTFITISFTKKAINIYANLSLLSITLISKFNKSHFANSDTSDYVSFHGKIGDSSTVGSKETIELGFFGVLNLLSFDDMKRLYHNGVFSYPLNPIFSYNASNHPTLADTTTVADSGIISNKSISVTSIVFNFIFCLTNLWKCDILIPLYSILNVPFENGNDEYYTELPYITTYIITKCLISNLKLQNYFYQTNKIRIIGYLLYRMSVLMYPKIVIDLRLYQYFYKMCLCVSNKELHSQIYFTIIANLKLINRSNPDDQIKILENWLSDVHQIPHFVHIGSFSVLLSLMNIFYKYEEIDQNKIEYLTSKNKLNADVDKIKKEIERNNKLVSSRREIFHHLLLFAADQSFELSDYYEIVNQCIELFQKSMKIKSIKDEEIDQSSLIRHNYIKEILDMLRFLNFFIQQSTLAFKKMKITLNDVLMLNELLVSNKNSLISEKIAVSLIDIIASFYKQVFFDSDQYLSVHFGLIIQTLSEMKLTNHFLKGLIHHSSKYSPEPYLVCCWFLSTQAPNDEELQDLFISSLSTSFSSLTKNCLSDPLYLFWSCLLANHLISEKKQRIFFAFIINTLYDNWHLMLPSILLYSESKDSTIMLYLNIASKIIFDKYNDINYSMNEVKKIKNLPMKSSRVTRSASYFSPKRRSSLDSYFASSSNFEAILNDEDKNNENEETIDDDDIKRFKRNSLSEKDLAVFIQFAVFFIFNRPKMAKMSLIEKMFVQSPFMDEEYEILRNENTNKKDDFYYGLRFDEDMKWIDFEFAKTIFNMRMHYKLYLSSTKEGISFNQNESKLFTILVYFIYHIDQQFAESSVVKINLYHNRNYTKLSSSVTVDSLIKSVFIHLDVKKITSDIFSDFYECSLSFLNDIKANLIQQQTTMKNNFVSLTTKIEELASLQKKIHNECSSQKQESSNEKNLSPISSLQSYTYIDSYENGITKLKRFMLLLEDYDRFKWEALMKNLNVDKGPWNVSSTEPFSFYYKRSMTLCSSFCPFLMKRKQKVQTKKTHKYTRDYFIHSDFYFWSHNHFLPSFEQTTFLNTNLNVAEKPSSDKYVLYDCILQKFDKFISCKLRIEPKMIEIIQEKEKEDGIKIVPRIISIDKNDISIILSKMIQGEPEKIEIFTNSCTNSYLLNCENSNMIIDSFINICNPQPNRVLVIKNNTILPLNSGDDTFSSYIQNIQKKWADKKFSNFEYIMILNILSGRSFNDIGQYPIFPWILKDYSSEKIDINEESIYRQFVLQNEGKEEQNNSSFCILPPSAVSSYLKRIRPFNEISFKCEFDNSDKKTNILTSIKNQYEESISQNKQQEITPEFFFMPEFLIGNEKFNLENVVLPPWCNNPTDFIYLHRKALESKFVTTNINDWIDLVFGCKQEEFGNKNSNSKSGNNDEPVIEPSASLSLMMRKEGLPLKIFTSPHLKQTTQIEKKENEMPTHHYIIKSQDEWEAVIYVYFECDNLYVFDNSLNVSKFSFKFDTFELSFVEKKALIASGNKDISFYQEFGFYLKHSSFVSQQSKRSIIAHNNFDLNSFCLIEIDPLFNISIKKYYLDSLSSDQKSEKSSIHLSRPDKEMTLVKIECSDGHFIVVSYSDELHLSILEIIDNENEKENDNKNDSDGVFNNFVIKRYEQFIAVPKCCAISSIFKTFVVATDDGSMQIASIYGNSPSNQWNLSKIVELNQNSENTFIPQKILITDSFGFIVVYGKMKMSSDENESFIYVFTINGIFIRSQKIDGEVVNWAKWKSQKGFDFLTLVIKKKYDETDENNIVNINSNFAHININEDENDEQQTYASAQKSYSISYKIAICEAYYLNLDILKYRFTEKIVSVEYLIERNLLAIFQSDGNFILANYEPNDLYME